MSTVKLLITTTIKRKDGTIRKTETRESKSFVLGWLQLLEVMMAHEYLGDSDLVTIKDTSASDETFKVSTQYSNKCMAAERAAGNMLSGILVGTGTTAPANDDHTLETKIAHGSAATQLQHGACVVNAAAIVENNVDMTIVRTFTNGSGNTITVKEVGLVLNQDNSGGTNKYVLVVRDAVDDVVLNTETYVCTYTFRTTV